MTVDFESFTIEIVSKLAFDPKGGIQMPTRMILLQTISPQDEACILRL